MNILKMSHICTIQALQEKITGHADNYKSLSGLTIERLEQIRNELIPIYNKTIEATAERTL